MAALIELDVSLKSGEVRLDEGEMKSPWSPFKGGVHLDDRGEDRLLAQTMVKARLLINKCEISGVKMAFPARRDDE